MTWTAHATVQSVSDAPAPHYVLATANIDDLVLPTGSSVATPATVSDEGRIGSVEIRLTLLEHEPALQVGDVITVYGRFPRS